MSKEQFSGVFNVSIDLKGRVSVPAGFRDVLREKFQSESLFVTLNKDGLTAYPPKAWNAFLSKYDALPASPSKEAVWRARVSPAQECTFNAQGRIQVPQALRARAGLEKDVVIVGMDDKIEIWNQQAYDAVLAKSETLLEEDGQLLSDLGL
ncbi:MraZ protein [Malonomonas rubra DSM 5091]|uniref:Transcriptional regulator MraZ n=1 Tax=Malonomonas rubra DSM 5091 TaxID=1122189 RepID=A0A1M6E6R8_MALRU|nr:division/cell wall cluster transcriptional repressor MraZ [Malonomonas rubra]SHI81069.1 MraZ protein [Malonomonas rubra DSM 5091]